MNAQEAKKLAAAHKKQQEENLKLKNEKLKNSDVALLYTHLHNKIEISVNKGQFNTEEITFPLNRFETYIIQEVVNKLKEEGFNLQMDKHNAYQTVSFKVTWL